MLEARRNQKNKKQKRGGEIIMSHVKHYYNFENIGRGAVRYKVEVKQQATMKKSP